MRWGNGYGKRCYCMEEEEEEEEEVGVVLTMVGTRAVPPVLAVLGGVDEEGRYVSLETQGGHRKKEEV